MINFLLRLGIRLTRVSEWPDYYDELPGGSAPGRTVVAELFNVNELGAWKDKLRPSFIVAPLPATLAEMMALPAYQRSCRGQALMLPGYRPLLSSRDLCPSRVTSRTRQR